MIRKALSALIALALVLGLALVLVAPVGAAVKTHLEILKVDSNNDTINAPGATFTITPDPYKTSLTTTLTVEDNDSNDKNPAYGTIRLENIKGDRKYTVTEIAAPAGYEPDPKSQTEYIGDQGGTFTFTFVNTPAGCKGEIEIYKKDEGTGALLGGACFNITPDPTSVDLTGTLEVCDSDSNDADASDGTIRLEDVPCGNYTITESGAPLGYVIATESQNVTVVNNVTENVTFNNTPCQGEIEIYKKDDKGEALGGACFNISPDPYDAMATEPLEV